MRQLTFLLVIFLLPVLLISQDSPVFLDLEKFSELKIRNIGPAGMSGRVTAIDVNRQHPNHIYVGTASGGVWKSESGGIAWDPIFDDAPVQSIGSIKINQKNPDDIWVGTGEGNPRNSHNSGKGIYRTLDGGRTWKLMGLENTTLIHRIIIHRDDPNTVIVGALGSAWGPSTDRGVYKTTDGGTTWNKVLFIGNQTGIADLVTDPQNPNKLIAATWEFGRTPWKFNSGGPGSGIHISYDAGATWEKITAKDKKSGLPDGPLGRIGLAVAPSKPNIIYALVEAKVNALYKSEDGGHKWKKIADKDIGNRPFYYAEIYVDPHNENRIWNLWSYVSKSEDGGRTFKTIMDYGTNIHPDHHAFWLSPDDPDYLINGNDGGMNISRDGGKNWRFVENLPVGQFYHINYDMSIPYRIGGGMQDNGTWVGPSSIWKSGGTRNADWREVLFGDGFDMLFRPDNSRHGMAMSQGGNLVYFDYETGQNEFIKPAHPDGEELRYNWNAPLAQGPFENCEVYFGSQYVHKTTDCGKTWKIISPDLTTNDTIKQKESAVTGGLTKDVTNAENFTTLTTIAPSPVDRELVWAGSDDGKLHLTRDGGKNWSEMSGRLPGLPTGSWFAQIEVSNKNAGEAFVVANNYRRNDFKPYAYHTSNYGATWKRIADERSVSGYAMCIVQDPVVPELLFMGTDYGLYFSLDGGQKWQQWKKDFPSVPTRDLKIHSRDHDLIIGTFGRAIWIMDDIRPLREIARTGKKVLKQDIAIFTPPDAYHGSYRSVDGVRFIANAEFRGPNRSPNGMFSIWVKAQEETDPKDKSAVKKKDKQQTKIAEKAADETEKDKKKKSDKTAVVIYDMQGDTVRNFTKKLKPGLNRVSWNLNENGIRFPSNRDPKPDADPPGGLDVLPGDYKVVVTHGEAKDSTTITVHANPHRTVTMDGLKRKYAQRKQYNDKIETATKDFNRLKAAKKTIKLVNEAMVHAPDSTKKMFKEMGKSMTDSITQLMALYMYPPDTKGIQRSSDKLTSVIFQGMGYFRGLDDEVSENGMGAIRKAERKMTEVTRMVNKFFSEDWKMYREKVEAIEVRLFE